MKHGELFCVVILAHIKLTQRRVTQSREPQLSRLLAPSISSFCYTGVSIKLLDRSSEMKQLLSLTYTTKLSYSTVKH